MELMELMEQLQQEAVIWQTKMATLTSSQVYCGIDFRLNNDQDDTMITSNQDFNLITYYDNLKQAIINRLRTGQGSLSLHPNYGSQLNELIGKNGNALILSEARQYVREALLQEPRISRINTIKTNFQEGSNNQIVVIQINVTPIGNNAEALNIIWDFFLWGGNKWHIQQKN